MKRSILWSAILAVAMASCSSQEDVTPSSSQKAIGFGTFVEKATKGTAVTGTGYPTNGQFLVLGYSTGTSDLDATAALNFMRQTVTFDGTNYSYSPLRYWPGDATSKISFFAVHPSSLASCVTPAAADYTATPAAASKQLPTVTYPVPAEPVNQQDLMLASAVNKKQADGTVSFPFTHALTKIGFFAKLATDYSANGTYVRISSISLTNVAGTATYTFGATGTATQTTPTDFTSTYTLGMAHFQNNGLVTSTTASQLNYDNSYLFMVPYSYKTNSNTTAKLTVTYVVTNADNTTSTVTSSTVLGNLTTGGDWAAASAINYTLTITLNSVSFSASTTDWGTATSVSL